MPRLSKRPPKMGRDGKYAVVYLNSKKIRLGRYGSDEAQREYRRFLAEWAAIGNVVDPHKKQSYLIEELAAAFLKWAKNVYGDSDYGNFKTAIEMTLRTHEGMAVKDFGPKALKIVQHKFVEKGYARDYCNKLTGFVRRMFVWGIEYEFVTQDVAGALKLVSSVHRKLASNRPPRKDVPDDVVRRTLPHLTPTIRDMVVLQRLTAMRPGDVCKMKACEIDRSGEIWKYVPPEHKNTWRGHTRTIFFGKPEQEILERRLTGKEPGQYRIHPARVDAGASGTSRRQTQVEGDAIATETQGTTCREPETKVPRTLYVRCILSRHRRVD